MTPPTTSSTPREAEEQAREVAERLLPCAHATGSVCCDSDEDNHAPLCPALFRDGVTAALVERDERVAELEAKVSRQYQTIEDLQRMRR